MRLWSQQLIPYLDRQRLLGQHRELAALRGKGWGKKHSVVDYVFTYEPIKLIAYHFLIMNEMEKRGYHPDPIWRATNWRGEAIGRENDNAWNCEVELSKYMQKIKATNEIIYKEHNRDYLRDCIENLESKKINTAEMRKLLNETKD